MIARLGQLRLGHARLGVASAGIQVITAELSADIVLDTEISAALPVTADLEADLVLDAYVLTQAKFIVHSIEADLVLDAEINADQLFPYVPADAEPQFTVRIYRPIGSANELAPLDSTTFDGYDVTFQFTTELVGGFGAAQIGGLSITEDEPMAAYLRPNAIREVPPLAHVEILAGMQTVWEGEISQPQYEGDQLIGITGHGYWEALNDEEFESDDEGSTIAGDILRYWVLPVVAPWMHVGHWDSSQIEHEPQDYTNMTGGAIADAIAREGDAFGNPIDIQVVANRTIIARRRIAPDVPHYSIDAGSPGVEIDEIPWTELVTRVRTRFTDAEGDEQSTDWINARDMAIIPDSPRQRSRTLQGGRLAWAAAIEIARTYLRAHATRRYGGTITLERGQGLRTTEGGERPGYLIRAGEWIDVSGTMMIIRRTSYSSTGETTIEIGEERPDFDRYMRRLQQATSRMANGLSPVTGGRAR